MRKTALLLLLILLVFSIASCGVSQKFDVTDVAMEVIEESVTPLGLTVCVSNNTKIDIYGGIADDFLIEKLENDKWSPLVETRDRTNNTETYIFQGNRELNIYWSEIYGSLAPGTYRISKCFYTYPVDTTRSSNEGFILTAEFIIE
jgi:hypothetical protein